MHGLVQFGTLARISEVTSAVPIGSVWVDLTNTAPVPQVGWAASLQDGVWSFAPVVPTSITNFQVRAILMATPSATAGRTLFQDVDDALRAQGGVALQAWEYANDVTRDGDLVGALGQRMGLTSAQLDALFVQAAQITA